MQNMQSGGARGLELRTSALYCFLKTNDPGYLRFKFLEKMGMLSIKIIVILAWAASCLQIKKKYSEDGMDVITCGKLTDKMR